MKCTYLWTGFALSAWLVFGPADLSRAQSTTIGSGNTAQGSAGGTGVGAAGSTGGTGPTTGVGGGVGGNFGGVSGGGVGGRYGGASGGGVGGRYSGGTTTPTNQNNTGAQDRYRGQGIDFSRDESGGGGVGTGNGNQFDRYNGGDNAATATARDRVRSQRERLNDNDDFQSDPYQSRQTSRDRQSYNPRRDAIERRRYQEDRLLERADGDRFRRYDDRYDGRYDDSPYSGNGGTTNIFVDDGYSSDGYVDGAYVDDYGNYIGRGIGTQYAPQRSYRGTVRNYATLTPARDRKYTNDRTERGRGASNLDPLPSGSVRRQSMDRAANFVDANLGRAADDQLDEELPAGSGTTAGRRVDARLDPRGR